MIKICVSGSRGKMGSRILALAKEDSALQVNGEFDIDADPEPFIKQCDCLIDFTAPKATMSHLSLCEKHKKAMVIGTTGLSDPEKDAIEKVSQKIPIIFSPNMSMGVNLVFGLVTEAAAMLGNEYLVSIKEAHHIHKKDAPSGTAKEIARLIKESRPDADIPIESIREDEIVGDHTVTFEGPFDRIQISHSAKTRDIFAKGALEAAKFISKKKKGLFAMPDVLFQFSKK